MTHPAHETHEDLDDRLLHRLLFFTDAVFAIVLTLLALELKPPETWREATAETLIHALPHIGAFVFSFFIIGIFWAANLNTTRQLARFDWPTALANLLFLLPVCLLPYATAWLGADLRGGFAMALYATVLILISACNMVLVLTAYRGGGRLIAGGATPRERAYRLFRAAAPGLAFVVALVLLALGQRILAHFTSVLIPVFFWLAGATLGPKRERTAA